MKTFIEILIDVSSSMNDYLPGDKKKIDYAKEILIDRIIPSLNYSDSIGIRLFGGKCGIINEVENIPKANFHKLKDFIENQIPEPNGMTPLALAIITSVDNLKRDPSADKEIYLVTDGEETCGGNIMEAAEYASRNGIDCKIHIIGIGDLSNAAIHQFEIITSKTGGKYLNIGRKGTSKGNIEKDLKPLFHAGIDDIVNLIDFEYEKRKETFKYYDNKTIKEYLLKKNLPINYIPSDENASCHETLIIEYYNDNLSNLIKGMEHLERCKPDNKEVLILMNNWNYQIHDHILKQWFDQYKLKGINRFCVKLDGFKAYKEFN